MLGTFKLAIERVEELFWDSFLGIDTRAGKEDGSPSSAYQDSVHYQAKCYYLIWRYLKPLQITARDVFYDIGCGKGRMICIAALLSPARCIGIEVSERLCAAARDNVRRLHFQHAAIEIRRQDAIAADYRSGTVFALFNPFGYQTMRSTLEAIRETVLHQPRVVRFVYVNPVARRAFEEADWLSLVADRRFAGSPLQACYYRSNPI